MEGIKINKATRDVILRATYPHAEGLPVPGFEHNGAGEEEWLIIVRDNYQGGTFDQRYWNLTVSEDAPETRIEHPDYPGVWQWVIKQQLVKNNIDDILINLENEENFANDQILPSRKFDKFVIVSLRGLIRKVISNVEPTQLEIIAGTYLVKAGLKIEQNYLLRKNKEKIIDSEPDMSADWITAFQEEEPIPED